MECIEPGLATNEELLAVADGEANRLVEAHIASCPRCAAVVESYARDQRRLIGALYRLDCPSSLALKSYQRGLLTPRERMTVAAHIVDCVPCGADLAVLRHDARAAPTDRDDPAGWRGRLVAALQPRPHNLAAGLRGTDDALQIYEAGEFTVAIEVDWDPARRRGTITGLLSMQEMQPDIARARAMLYDGGDTLVNSATVEATDTFSLAGVAAGTYRVDLAIGARVIVIGGIDVGPGYPP